MNKYLLVFFVISYLLQGSLLNAQNIPVDHYSGQPVISVPLQTISDRSLSCNVALYYDASGVKVNSTAGWVGQNWSLDIGGVSREMHGLPDDYYSTSEGRYGWLFNNNSTTVSSMSTPGTSLNCTNESTPNGYIAGRTENNDIEPDLFHFSAPGLSGSFVFDNTGSISGIKLIPYQDISITATRSTSTSPITSFTIITPDGVKYIFDAIETSNRLATKIVYQPRPLYFTKDFNQAKVILNYNSGWKLSSMTSACGEKITFTYASNAVSSTSNVTVAQCRATDAAVPNELPQYTIRTDVSQMILASINAPHQSLSFVTNGSGENVLLDKITVNEFTPTTTSLIKTIDLSYLFLESTVDATTYYRTFLDKVTVIDQCQAKEPYQFVYNSVTAYGNGTNAGSIALPTPGHVNQDIWGYYYNTGTTAHKYPKLYVYPSQTGINRISLYQIAALSSEEVVIPGANRVHEDTSTAGVLSGINYPSGAYTSITYEPHEFYNPIKAATSKGAGLRVASMTIYDGITILNTIEKTYTYKKPDNSSSGKLLTMPAFWRLETFLRDSASLAVTPWSTISSSSVQDQWRKTLVRRDDNIAEDFDGMRTVGYEYVTEQIGTGNGHTTFQFEIPFSYGASASGDWSPTLVGVARSSAFHGTCPSVGLILPSYYVSPFLPQTPYGFERGLLIKTSVYKEGDSNPEREVTNVYKDKLVSDVIVKGLPYDIFYTDTLDSHVFYMYGILALSTNKTRVLDSTVERTKSKTTSDYLRKVIRYTYGSNHAFLASSSMSTSEGATLVSTYKYVKDYGAPQASNSGTDLQVRMLDALYSAGSIGTLVEQTLAKTVSSTITTYEGTLKMFDDFGTSTAPVIKAKEIYSLKTPGITSFPLSYESGSGTSRVFNKSTSYKKMSTFKYKSLGDMVRVEDNQRQIQSFHPDSLSGVAISSILNAEPGEVIYSNFDQDTKYDFDIPAAFTSLDRTAYAGRTNTLGLGGFKASTATTKYLQKTFVKRPGVKYLFSTWYSTPVSSGTHSLDIVIKNTSGTQLLTQTLTFSVGAASTWYYGEKLLDLSSLSDVTVIVEVRFSGSYSGGGAISSTLDEVSFIPVGTTVVRNTYNTAFGLTAVTAPDGMMTENERTAAGQIKYVRDKDRNILQAVTPTRYQWSGGSTPVPISIVTDDVLYDNVLTYFQALYSCLDAPTIQWKVSSSSDAGSFATGTNVQAYTFPASGNYTVYLSVVGPGYNYTVSKPVTVILKPLTVSLSVTAGSLSVDICSSPYVYTTTFLATVSGCSGSPTYTYSWYTRPLGDNTSSWTFIGTGTTLSSKIVNNISSYNVKCAVTSSCSRSGESDEQAVVIYKSNPSCSDPIAP